MECYEVEGIAALLYALGLLPKRATTLLQKHLRQCQPCRQVVADQMAKLAKRQPGSVSNDNLAPRHDVRAVYNQGVTGYRLRAEVSGSRKLTDILVVGRGTGGSYTWVTDNGTGHAHNYQVLPEELPEKLRAIFSGYQVLTQEALASSLADGLPVNLYVKKSLIPWQAPPGPRASRKSAEDWVILERQRQRERAAKIAKGEV